MRAISTTRRALGSNGCSNAAIHSSARFLKKVRQQQNRLIRWVWRLVVALNACTNKMKLNNITEIILGVIVLILSVLLSLPSAIHRARERDRQQINSHLFYKTNYVII